MNPDEILQKMKSLTEEIKAREGTLSEDDLGDFLQNVSDTLGEVFNLATDQVHQGLSEIEKAQRVLRDSDLEHEAEAMTPLLDSMHSVRTQLEIGREVAQQKRDFQDYGSVPQPERVLTPAVLKNLLALERALAAGNPG